MDSSREILKHDILQAKIKKEFNIPTQDILGQSFFLVINNNYLIRFRKKTIRRRRKITKGINGAQMMSWYRRAWSAKASDLIPNRRGKKRCAAQANRSTCCTLQTKGCVQDVMVQRCWICLGDSRPQLFLYCGVSVANVGNSCLCYLPSDPDMTATCAGLSEKASSRCGSKP